MEWGQTSGVVGEPGCTCPGVGEGDCPVAVKCLAIKSLHVTADVRTSASDAQCREVIT